MKIRDMLIWEQDKLLHFFYGAIICAGLLIAGASPLVALGVVAGIGVAKELYDAMFYGTPEIADGLATTFGGLIVVLPWMY